MSEAVASLPLHVFRYNDSGGKEKALAHPLYGILHDEPNPEMSAFSFRETLMTHLLLWGNGYAQVIRNGRGEIVALYPLMPDRMAVDRDAQGKEKGVEVFFEKENIKHGGNPIKSRVSVVFFMGLSLVCRLN